MLVDGHNSHYTRGFLEYAREHRIHVLCYPSHSTHLYQGLDVVIFSILKRAWTEFRDAFERNSGKKVTKSNFLTIYAQAHNKALTKENIIAAFAKTGVVPFNPDVITDAMMAPSLETSTSAHAAVVLDLPSPVKIISELIQRTIRKRKRAQSVVERDECNLQENDNAVQQRIHNQDSENSPSIHPSSPTGGAYDAIRDSSASFLLNSSPLQSHMKPPNHAVAEISPFKNRYQHLLNEEPLTEQAKVLQEALREAQNRESSHKTAMISMQATVVLNTLFVAKAQTQLQAAEESAKPKPKKKRLMTDGMPRLLDGDVFFDSVVQQQEEAVREEREKEERREVREQHAERISEWKKEDKARIERNNECREKHQEAVKLWEAERDLAKSEKRRPHWKKPKLEGIEPPIPRPVLKETTPSEDEISDAGSVVEGVEGDNSGSD